MLYGALETGGSRTICAVGDESGQVLEKEVIITSTPDETMAKVLEYFRAKLEVPEGEEAICALGVGSFGPVDVRKHSKTYGNVLNTPKIAWRNYPIVQTLKDALNIPVGLDTDVNAALLGEVVWGAAKGLSDAVYIKIGAGIGMGAISGGHLIHGMLHPEIGHIKMVRVEGDTYKGHCPNHGACFEGMACGPAIHDRWGKSPKELADNAQVWEFEARYISQALTAVTLMLSPQKIILGGGVMHQSKLFPLIRKYLLEEINNYIDTKELRNIDSYVVPAALNDNQGIMGALKLAEIAATDAAK